MNVLLAENLKNPAWQRAPPSDPVFPALGCVGWMLMCPTFYQQLHTAARYCTLSALRWIPHFWPRHKGTASPVFYIHFSLVSAFLRYLILPMLAFSQKQIHLCSKVFSWIIKSFGAVIFFSNNSIKAPENHATQDCLFTESAVDSWITLVWTARVHLYVGFPGGSAGKESACKAGDLGSISGLGRPPGEGNGYPLQCSGLEHSMDCIERGVTESRARLSGFTFTHCSTVLP